ncbi:MAG: OmpA family protein [Myxococcaceae bacterium]
MGAHNWNIGSVAGVLLALLSATASAQGFDGQRYQPAMGAAGGFVIERPIVPRHLGYSFGLIGNYGHDPVVIRRIGSPEIVGRPLQHALTADLLASFALFNVLELGVDVPLHALYMGDTSFAGARAAPGIGDIRLMPKLAHTFGGSFALGLAAPITVPTGDPGALRGNGGLTVHPQLLMGFRGRRFSVSANAGMRLRPEDAPSDILGDEVTYGLGAQIPLLPRRDMLDLYVEGFGSYYLGSNLVGLSSLPIEALAGLALRPHPDWTIELGGGGGITRGVGDPLFRTTLGVRYNPVPASDYKDSDNDGVGDHTDKCPRRAEDEDGFEDADGCPEYDNDRDGVSDERDECPDEPEGRIGDGDGCPEPDVSIVRGRIVIKGKVQFETGSTHLKPKSHRLLDRVAVLIKKNPEVRRVRIEGHTDEVGPKRSNQELSRDRADVVKKELIRRGVPAKKLESRGYGETRPVAPNKTAAGRAKNRRVEFTLIN